MLRWVSPFKNVTLKTLRQIALILSQLKLGHLITSLTKFEEKAREVGVHLRKKICRFVVDAPGRYYREGGVI